MKLFIDTANLHDIEDAFSKGIIQGVTTNPSLLAKEPKIGFYTHIQKIADICKAKGNNCPLSVEVFAIEKDEIIKQAKEILSQIDYPNLNIKIPIGYQELGAISELKKENIRVNCTCCFSTTQMQLAALAGAKYVSLFYNRLIDIGGSPIEVISRVRKFIDDNKLDCEIIAGSIRNPYDLENCWNAGCDIVTAGYKVIVNSTKHVKTDESINEFLTDFKTWIK